MEEISGAQHLGQWRGDAHHAVRSLAALLAKLHNEGFSHRDLKETNLVFDSAGKLYVIDLDGLEFMDIVPRERALGDLERLERAAKTVPWFTAELWTEFIKLYSKLREPDQAKFFA